MAPAAEDEPEEDGEAPPDGGGGEEGGVDASLAVGAFTAALIASGDAMVETAATLFPTAGISVTVFDGRTEAEMVAGISLAAPVPEADEPAAPAKRLAAVALSMAAAPGSTGAVPSSADPAGSVAVDGPETLNRS